MSSSTSSSATRSYVSMQHKYERVILLVDMDCFFCQVEVKQEPAYIGKPLAVVQYNAWRGGGIIAVNYAARAKGVTRHMRGDEAKDLCPDIVLCRVPNIREKADTSKYRDAGKEVANVLQRFTQLLERASVDEAYLDITDTVNKRMAELQKGSFALKPQELVNTYAVGYSNIGDYVNKITNRFAHPYIDDERFQLAYDQNDLPAVRQSDIRLLIGACIAGEVRAAVKADTGYECSAGVAHNKILAKLAAGMNKPNKQTILPLNEIPGLFESLPVGKIKGLGGKFGEDVCERLGVKFLGQLLRYTESELQRKFDEKNGTWLHYISRGIDLETVTPRFYSKSIGCCKKFPGRNNITGLKTLQHWLSELASEINDRLEKDLIENNRKAKQMVVQYVQELDGEEVASSRSAPLKESDQETLAKSALELIKANTKTFCRPGSETALNNAIKFLGISVGKFETISNTQNKLQEMFANQAAKKRRTSEEEATTTKPEQREPLEKQKPKESEESKMKSFFANYLQGRKNEPKAEEQQIEAEPPDSKKVSAELKPFEEAPTNKAVAAEPTDKILFEEYKKKLREVTAAQGIATNASPPNSQPSFFAKFLQQQRDSAKAEEEQNESKANVESEDSEIHLLAAELDDIESSNANVADQSEPVEEQPSTSKRKLDSPEQTVDYKNSYAEYALPELRAELLTMIKCEQCGAQIPDDALALQTHKDHHFAQELSRQQRAEQREEIQQSRLNVTKVASPAPAPVSKKQKKTATGVASPANSITKFLAAKIAPATKPPSGSDVPMERCAECQTYINTLDMPEHMDYHMAKQLQRQINQLEVRTVHVANKKSSPGQPKKQLNASMTAAGNKTIAQFFTQDLK